MTATVPPRRELEGAGCDRGQAEAPVGSFDAGLAHLATAADAAALGAEPCRAVPVQIFATGGTRFAAPGLSGLDRLALAGSWPPLPARSTQDRTIA